MRRRPKSKAEIHHWTALRRRCIRRAGGKCERCRGQLWPNETQAHHLTYERWGAELESDVLIICLNCHEQIHGRKLSSNDELKARRLKAAQRKRLKPRRDRLKRKRSRWLEEQSRRDEQSGRWAEENNRFAAGISLASKRLSRKERQAIKQSRRPTLS